MIKELFWLIKLLFTKTGRNVIVGTCKCKHFPFRGYSAMMWCGYIITRTDSNVTPSDTTVVHEWVHLHQAYKYKYWYSYYLRYLWSYIKGRCYLKGHNAAYYTIPYEMEAYAKETDSFIRYFDDLDKFNKNRKLHIRFYKDNKDKPRSYFKSYCKSLLLD